ncbi:uncharacterized protein LOC134819996 isoform X2 [Bolinopsis microptera]|uniref:uncharacterized protein LOC134819996 isoform X2 n=1 Tax=Bolinopsis microptera TaxID=2820187 RepID=UPI00307A6330
MPLLVMTTVESKDSSSSGSSGSEYSSSGSSGSEYSGDSSADDTDSEESDSESLSDDNVKEKTCLSVKLATNGDNLVPPWQINCEPTQSSEIDKNSQGGKKILIQATRDQTMVKSSLQKSVTFQDRDKITETRKECLVGVNKNIVASTNKSNKTKRAPVVATTILSPDVDNCSSDVSMEVDKGKLKNRSLAKDFDDFVETNTKFSETPDTIKKQTNKPTSITKHPSLSEDLLAKASSDIPDHPMDHPSNKEVTDLSTKTTDKSSRKTRDVTRTKTKVAVTSSGISKDVSEDVSEDVSGVGTSGAAEDAAEDTAEEFCSCRGEEYGLMVQCEKCSEWYHNGCLDLTKLQIENIEVFYCTTCHSVDYQLVTITKTNIQPANILERSNEFPLTKIDQMVKNAISSQNEDIQPATSPELFPELPSDNIQVQPFPTETKIHQSETSVSEGKVAEGDDKGSSDEEWVDIAVENDSDLKSSSTEPSVNFIARTKEMLAKKPLASEGNTVVLPVTSPMDLKRNEFWDENFYKPHINEDLSSCFSQMSIDWESARKIFCQSTISPLKDGKTDGKSYSQAPKTPLRGSAQNTRRELLNDPTTPTRAQFVPTPADPEVMKIFERSLLVSPCKKMVRPIDHPSRRLSLIKIDDQVTMNFGKSPSPVTAREMGRKLFSGKLDWNSHNTNEKENSTPKTPTKVQKTKAARNPLFSDKPLDKAWAKGLDEIKGDYPFYSLKKNQQTEVETNKNTAKVDHTKNIRESSPEIDAAKQSTPELSTTPKKSKVDDSHLFKTPTKSVRRMRKKSVSSDRQSGGWSPGARLLEHSCPYDPTESGCYSQTIDSQTPIKVPLAPTLDSITKYSPGAKKTPNSQNSSINFCDSRSFEIEFEDLEPSIKSNKSPPISSESNVTVKTILPKLFGHLEKTSHFTSRKWSGNNEKSSVEIAKDPEMDESAEPCLLQKYPETDKSASVHLSEKKSPSKSMKDVPSFIEGPVEDTLDFEENETSPDTSAKNVLIGYGSEFCDEGEVFSSDDDENMFSDLRAAQRNALRDSPETSKTHKTNSSSYQKAKELRNAHLNQIGSDLSKNNTSNKTKSNSQTDDTKLLADKEFLERNKVKYTSENSVMTTKPDEPKGQESSSSDFKKSLPFTFQPIAVHSLPTAPNAEASTTVKKPFASTPRKSLEERCDTPLSALHEQDNEDLPMNPVSPDSYAHSPASDSNPITENSVSNNKNPGKSTLNVILKKSQTFQNDSSDLKSGLVDHETKTQDCTTDINQILISCETLSNPSVTRPLPITPDEDEDATLRKEEPSLSVNYNSKAETPQMSKFLSSDEILPYTPKGPIQSIQQTETPLSAAFVYKHVAKTNVGKIQSDVEPLSHSHHEEVRPQESTPTVNFLLSSEETMSNWTPEPSPTDSPSSDPMDSMPARRRISLHDYVIRKETVCNTPALPDCSFSTPEFAKSNDLVAESPLAVEHDSRDLECTQSPISMEHELISQTPETSSKRGELVAKLKYHHLIPIYIPPREFLYCRRVKMIQNMLINELIGGAEFKSCQPITQPLYGTRAESGEQPDRPAARSEIVQMIQPSDTNQSDQIVSQPPTILQQQFAPVSTRTPESSILSSSVSKHAAPAEQTAPAKPVLSSKPMLPSVVQPGDPRTSKTKDVTDNSGMGNAKLHDDESHDYFKNVKIPKVKRVTDTFMSDSSVLNSYDCGPDTIAVGNMIQQSMANDASSVSLDSIDRPSTSLNSSTAPSSGVVSRITSNLGTSDQAVIPSVVPYSTQNTTSRSSNDLEMISSYVKQCLFSDEGISKSPIMPSSSQQSGEECGSSFPASDSPYNTTSNQSRGKSSFIITHPSGSAAKDLNVSHSSPTSLDRNPQSVLEEPYIAALSPSSEVHSDNLTSGLVDPFPVMHKEEDVVDENARGETTEIYVEPVLKVLVKKPPKFKIPKKKTPAPCTSPSPDPLLTSPRKIKQFISSSTSAEQPSASTLFTQRKKKQLDVIITKERAQREQVLQEYLGNEQGNKPAELLDESLNSSQTRKRRKTDSPEPPHKFDLRHVLSSSKVSAKPECKRTKHRSTERNKSNDSEIEKRKSERTSRESDENTKKKSKEKREKDPQLGFKSKLFDALAVLNTKERALRIPDKMAGRHASLTHWLDSWKDDEVRLKELRTTRLKIRDPNYQPRDLSRLKLSNVPKTVKLKPQPAKKKERRELTLNKEDPEIVFGWKNAKPDSCHINMFPDQQSDTTNTPNTSKPASMNPLLNKANPRIKKSNPLLKKKSGGGYGSKIQAPKIWIECIKRADEAHCNPKQIRKKTVIDIMTTKTSGPLSTLQRALTANVKVTVITRTFKGIRGECTGYLVAYDRFMNLALSDVTEHYRSLYHNMPDEDKEKQQSTSPTFSSDEKFQSDPTFVDFKRSVTVSFDRDMLQEIKSPSQSPERTDTSKQETVLDRGGVRSPGDVEMSPGASIRSPSLSPPSSENNSPAKQHITKKKGRTLPGLLGWSRMTPEHRKFKYTKNCITTRYCKQVFLRGDNIVLVRLVE